MPTSQKGGRFLIAAGTQRYRLSDEFPELPKVSDDIDRIVRLFAANGYERKLNSVSTEPTAARFKQHFRRWLRSPRRTPNDIVVIYYTGHGFMSQAGKYLLATVDTDPRKSETAIDSTMFVEALEHGKVRYMLLIFDTCYAGGAANADITKILENLGKWRPLSEGPQLAILASARRELADDGVFPKALADAVLACKASTGDRMPYISLSGIVGEINYPIFRTLGVKQQANLSIPAPITSELPFFPNPGFFSGLPVGIDLETQRRIISGDLKTHWDPRSRGVEIDAQMGWHFSGRTRILTELIERMTNPGAIDSPIVVLGRPGSGKSAILARIVTLSDPAYRSRASPGDVLASTIPRPGLIDVAINCRSKTLSDVTVEMSVGLGLSGQTGFNLAEQIRKKSGTTNIIIDSLDEANEPESIFWNVLRMLASSGACLIFGLRKDTLSIPDGVARVYDIDDCEYIAVQDIEDYVLSLLSGADSRQNVFFGPGRDQMVAKAVAARAFPNFLVARMIVRNLIEVGQKLPLDDPNWADKLPASPSAAFEEYLERFGARRQRVQDLLCALAYAEDRGLPIDDVWITLARAVAGRSYQIKDILDVIRIAAAYIVEELDQGVSVYRLYHWALADYLRLGQNQRDIQFRIANDLQALVPLQSMESPLKWFTAPRYVIRNLATHAGLGGCIDSLLVDAGFLLAAEPDRLQLAMAQASSFEARINSETFQRVSHLFKDQVPSEIASYLEYSAYLDGNVSLARKISLLPLSRRWKTEWANWEKRSPYTVLAQGSISLDLLALTETATGDAIIAPDFDHGLLVISPSTGRTLPLNGTRLPIDPRTLAATRFQNLPLVAFGGTFGEITCWSPMTGRTTASNLIAHRASVLQMGFATLDERPVVVSCGLDGMLMLWDAETMLAVGEPLSQIPGWIDFILTGTGTGEPFPIRNYPLDIDGYLDKRHVILLGRNNRISVFSDDASGEIQSLGTLASFGPGKFYSCIARGDPLENRIVIGTFDGEIQVWDLRERRPLTTNMKMQNDFVTLLVLHVEADYQLAASGGITGIVYLWDIKGMAFRQRYVPHHSKGSLTALDFKRVRGRLYLVAGYYDGSLSIWDVEIDRIDPISLFGNEGAVSALALGTANERPCVVTVGGGATLRRWYLDAHPEGLVDPANRDPLGPVLTVAVEGNLVGVGSESGEIRLLDFRDGSRKLRGDVRSPVRAISFLKSEGRSFVCTVSYDDGVSVWDLSTNLCVTPNWFHEFSPTWETVDIKMIGRNVLIASLDNDYQIRVRDFWTGNVLGMPVPLDVVRNADQKNLDLAEVDENPIVVVDLQDQGGIRAYDVLKGCLHRKLHDGMTVLSTITVAKLRQKAVVISSYSDDCIRAWDLKSGDLIGRYPLEDSLCGAIGLGVIGGCTIIVSWVVGMEAGVIKAWRFPEGELFFTLKFPHEVLAIVVSEPLVIIGTDGGVLAFRLDPQNGLAK